MEQRLVLISFFCISLPLASLAAADCSDILNTSSSQSSWVSVNNQAELVYRLSSRGDKIMDFSYAGYAGGGVALPQVSSVLTLQPSGQDDTKAIQAALDKVASLPLQNGFRGAVLLAPGIYSTHAPLRITASGVVLRGSGSKESGSLIKLVGEPHIFLQMGKGGQVKLLGKPVQVTDSYVPSGAMQIHLESTKEFKPGDAVILRRPVTHAWVEFMDMDDLCANCDWLSPPKSSEYDRIVTAVDPNQKLITLDAPIPDSLDRQYTHANLVKYRMTDRIENVGLENLQVDAPVPDLIPVPFTTGPTFSVLKIDGVQNAWAQNLEAKNFVTGVIITGDSKWITLQDFAFRENPPSVAHGAKQFQYLLNKASMVLCNRCTAGGDNVYSFVTGELNSGPNVILNSQGLGSSQLEPHMRWATGLLVDNFVAPQGRIDFMSRGFAGSGHGWAMGWGVIWNSVAAKLSLQQAPGSLTWAIGDSGEIVDPPFPAGGPGSRDLPNQYPATIESFGRPVSPKSLYLAQLCVRKGRAAVANLGY